MSTIDEILISTIRKAESLVLDLKKCKVKHVKTVSISSKSLFNRKERLKSIEDIRNLQEKYIYIFHVVGSDNDIERITKTYIDFDMSNKPRIPGQTFNISKFNKTNSNCLYVGSSKDIYGRIKQHLGDGNKRTYSLDLHHWFPKKIDLLVEVYSINSQTQEVLEFVEQGFWDDYKPLFGKRSGQ